MNAFYMFLKMTNFFDHSYARNVAFAFMMGFLCVFFSSASTALFVAASVFVIFINSKISTKQVFRESLELIRKVPIVLVFPIFYFIVVATSFRGDYWLTKMVFVAGSYWQFLVIIPASIGLYRLSKDLNFAGLFSCGCRAGLLFVVPIAVIQIYFFNLRPEGIFSNTLVFASLCITGAGLAIIEWPEDTHNSRTWSWIAFAAGIVATLLTFSRGMLIPLAAIAIITIHYRFNVRSQYKMSLKIVVILCAVIAGSLAVSIQSDKGWHFVNQRFIQPIEMYNEGKPFERSIGQRLDMQTIGFYAFLKRPLTGYGIENTVMEANSLSEEVLGKKTNYTFTHLHNDYLTHAVGGGVILLILFVLIIFSPVIMSWQFRKNKNSAALFYFSLMISGAYSTIGITNIVFHNDQLATIFCVATMFIIIRRIQLLDGMEDVRIPDLPTIANGINPIGLVPEDNTV